MSAPGVPLQRGRTTARAKDPVAPPPPPPGFDRFGSSNVVRFRERSVPPFLGTYAIEGASAERLGTLRRDGIGWRVVELNFSLDNPEGRSVYRIRMPRAHRGVGVGAPFHLEDPFGTSIGELTWRFPQVASLRMLRGPTYHARVPGWRTPFLMEAPGRGLARATYLMPRMAHPSDPPPGLEIAFTPACGGSAERSVLVAFAAFLVAMARPGRGAAGAGP